MENMKLKDYLAIIPEQYTGKDIETESTASFNTPADAISFYEIARSRLLNVDEWHAVAGFVSGRFYLVNRSGQKLNRLVAKGDYFKISIPGPGNPEGDGYDWVQVEELKEISSDPVRSIGFRVRPSQNPVSETDKTAHFYSKEATSTFIVTQKEHEVIVQIIDLNLKPNKEVESVADKIRNVAVGAGALGLFSKVQWKSLADGIVRIRNV